MFALKYLVAVSVVSCVFGRKHHRVRIVGGQEAPLGKFPHQVSLQQSGEHSCAGSILSNRWLLSAAHCIGINEEVLALVGTTNLDEGGVQYDIKKVYYNTRFNPMFGWHDLSLLKTKKKIQFDQNVSPIALGTDVVGGGVDVILCGWGMIKSPNHPSQIQAVKQLRYIKLKTIENSQCKKDNLLPISDKQICTLTKAGEGACFGDSGGGLINEKNNKLIGVLSRGSTPNKCGVGTPDVYMLVSAYMDWIEKHMKK